MIVRSGLFLLLLLFLNACVTTEVTDSGPSGTMDVSHIPDAKPWNEPLSRGGNPSSYVVFGKRYYVLESSEDFKERGVASWYGNKFHGHKTSNGETYDMYAMTAAHKRLPIPSYVRVTNLNNRRSVVVRVNDRGPFHEGRIIDLSYVAATKLGINTVGTAPVEIVAINSTNNVVASNAIIRDELVAVQAGAFSERTRAEQVKKLIASSFSVPIKITEVKRSGKKLFRVRLGPFENLSTAESWLNKLNQMSLGQASLVFLN